MKCSQAPPRTARPSAPHSQTSPFQSSPSVHQAHPPTPGLRCAGSHWARDCQFPTTVCYEFGKTGHIRCACHSKGNNHQHRWKPHKLSQDTHCLYIQESDNHDNQVYNVLQLTGSCADPFRLVVTVDGVDLPMELEISAAVSIISHRL